MAITFSCWAISQYGALHMQNAVFEHTKTCSNKME